MTRILSYLVVLLTLTFPAFAKDDGWHLVPKSKYWWGYVLGGVQVGAYNVVDKSYRSYNASNDTWGLKFIQQESRWVCRTKRFSLIQIRLFLG
jgi:hypothetical protein